MTIEQLSEQLRNEIPTANIASSTAILKAGFSGSDISVSFHRTGELKAIRRDAGAEKYLNPAEGFDITIHLVPRHVPDAVPANGVVAAGAALGGSLERPRAERASPTPNRSQPSSDQRERPGQQWRTTLDPETPKAETDALNLIHALDRVASDPRVNFIGLKWFRDHVLREAGLSSFEARAALEAAIQRGWVKVEKLNNPNSPFPTSTLRLNRTPEVVAELEREPAAPARRGFSPIEVPGVSLSDTVLQARR